MRTGIHQEVEMNVSKIVDSELLSAIGIVIMFFGAVMLLRNWEYVRNAIARKMGWRLKCTVYMNATTADHFRKVIEMHQQIFERKLDDGEMMALGIAYAYCIFDAHLKGGATLIRDKDGAFEEIDDGLVRKEVAA